MFANDSRKTGYLDVIGRRSALNRPHTNMW